MRMLMILALALAVGLAAAGDALAQSAKAKNGARYGDWTLQCGASGACALIRKVKRKDGGIAANVFLRIRKTKKGPRVLMNVNFQDGVALRTQPRFFVDKNKETGALTWITCSKQRCQSVALLTPKQQGWLMAGNVMRVAYKKFGQDKWTAVPVSLRGVTAGLAALAAR